MKKLNHLLSVMLFGILSTPAFAQKTTYIGKINDVVATYKKVASNAANNRMTLDGQVSHFVPVNFH